MNASFYKKEEGKLDNNHSCSHRLEINEHDYIGCVARVPIFNHLQPEQMNEIKQVIQTVKFKKGELMYRAGEHSDALYIVYLGQIKIYRLSESGKEQLIRILKHGDFTGELALFQQGEHEAYAEALVDSQICMIKRKDLQPLLLKYPTISLAILNEFASRLDLSEKQTANVATEKVETRIATYLLELLEEKESSSTTIELPMSKKDLASYLGTTPETLSRRLRDFEEEGMIEQKGQRKIKILDEDALLSI